MQATADRRSTASELPESVMGEVTSPASDENLWRGAPSL